MKYEYLVLFDVDGTLLRTGGVSTATIRASLEQVFGTAVSFDGYSLSGRCITEIMDEVLPGSGISASQIERNRSKVYHVMVTTLA